MQTATKATVDNEQSKTSFFAISIQTKRVKVRAGKGGVSIEVKTRKTTLEVKAPIKDLGYALRTGCGGRKLTRGIPRSGISP